MDVNSESAANYALTKKVLWKLDCHILPPLALVRLNRALLHSFVRISDITELQLWLANFIDRSNVGNAG